MVHCKQFTPGDKVNSTYEPERKKIILGILLCLFCLQNNKYN